MSTERDRCLLTGAWRRATCFDYVSRAFIVTHNGKRRIVFNLKHLNAYHTKKACKFGSLSSLRRTLAADDWMWSIDLSDAYHHVGVHEDDQKYFTFAIETGEGVEYFSTPALNFGWCNSPQVFTEVLKPVVAYLRNPSVADGALRRRQQSQPHAPATSTRAPHVLPWLDDFFFSLTGTEEQALTSRDASFETLEMLGITRNVSKGQPKPSQLMHDHLGYGIDSQSMRFLLTDKREKKPSLSSATQRGTAA